MVIGFNYVQSLILDTNEKAKRFNTHTERVESIYSKWELTNATSLLCHEQVQVYHVINNLTTLFMMSETYCIMKTEQRNENILTGTNIISSSSTIKVWVSRSFKIMFVRDPTYFYLLKVTYSFIWKSLYWLGYQLTLLLWREKISWCYQTVENQKHYNSHERLDLRRYFLSTQICEGIQWRYMINISILFRGQEVTLKSYFFLNINLYSIRFFRGVS